jgi:hypothetical protein
MNDELQPVGGDEFVLRRIPASFFTPGLPVPVQLLAFRPTERDTDGLSVFRERFTQHPADILCVVEESKRGLYYVARLAVRDLSLLSLTVVPMPVPGLPGHAVIPELSWPNYQNKQNKVRLKDVQLQLAILAGRGIVHGPGL